MKNKLYLIATVAFLVLSVDLICVYLFSDKRTDVCCACPDFSKHTGHSHNHPFEDEVLQKDSDSSQLTALFNDLLLSPVLLTEDSYCSKVWQPPRI